MNSYTEWAAQQSLASLIERTNNAADEALAAQRVVPDPPKVEPKVEQVTVPDKYEYLKCEPLFPYPSSLTTSCYNYVFLGRFHGKDLYATNYSGLCALQVRAEGRFTLMELRDANYTPRGTRQDAKRPWLRQITKRLQDLNFDGLFTYNNLSRGIYADHKIKRE